MDAFTVEVDHVDGGVRVSLVGELDLAAVPTLETELKPLLPRYEVSQVELDCRRLAFMDTAGMAGLLRAVRRFGPDGTPVLSHVPSQVAKLVRVTGADDVLTIHASEVTA